ncbi:MULTISPECIES: hypothetical protein [Fischerella]|nr:MULTISPECIES: hypothetical protein [Fischerella]BAU05369.1 hypothetical protein FIS3754_12640 [Fischerella sp. NIES-3754]
MLNNQPLTNVETRHGASLQPLTLPLREATLCLRVRQSLMGEDPLRTRR